MAIDDKQLTAWQASIHMSERLAAEIVRWGRDEEPGTIVPYGTVFVGFPFDADEWDSALRLLVDEGFLTLDRGDHFIAPETPA